MRTDAVDSKNIGISRRQFLQGMKAAVLSGLVVAAAKKLVDLCGSIDEAHIQGQQDLFERGVKSRDGQLSIVPLDLDGDKLTELLLVSRDTLQSKPIMDDAGLPSWSPEYPDVFGCVFKLPNETGWRVGIVNIRTGDAQVLQSQSIGKVDPSEITDFGWSEREFSFKLKGQPHVLEIPPTKQ